MGKAQMPIGTIRSWQGGDVIKAHGNSILSSGWIPLQTSPILEEIGRDCDGKANSMRNETKPINGELFLDHEINEFEKDEKGNHPFNPDNFKQYEGFYGAGRYSFRNEFSKRFMADKIQLQEDIHAALLEANEDAGGVNFGDLKKDVLSAERKKEIKLSTKYAFKFSGIQFTANDARRLQGVVTRTYNQLKIGVTFAEGSKEKQVYDNAIKVAESLNYKYDRIGIKRKLKEDTLNAINETFKDNWGVRESVKKLLEEQYAAFVRNFSKQIRNDEGKEQESAFGIKLDDDVDKFYSALFKKVKEDKERLEDIDLSKYVGQEFKLKNIDYILKKDEQGLYVINKEWENDKKNEEHLKIRFNEENELEQKIKLQIAGESKYPFKELIYLRFTTLYGKNFVGDWDIDMLPVIYNIEKFMTKLPEGHFKTNKDVTTISNKDFGGAKGYAFYQPDRQEINFSKEAASAFSVWGDLKQEERFNSTCAHEIGHAVSQKFGRSGNINYKKFVVASGWDYQALKLSGEHASGSDKGIPRTGTHASSKLLTDYAHVAPEEAFAEYYSIYANNKEVIDKFLATKNSEFLNQKSKLVVSEKKKTEPTLLYKRINVAKASSDSAIEQQMSNLKLKSINHLSIELINPWHVKYDKSINLTVNDKKHGMSEARNETITPIVVIKNKLHEYKALQDEFVNEGAKLTKKFVPAVIITEEMYHHLSKNYNKGEIINYSFNKLRDATIPVQESVPVFKKGLEYNNDILETKDLVRNELRFQLMKNIFESPSLKKALIELFSFNKIKNIFAINGVNKEDEIAKAKVDELVCKLAECDDEIMKVKETIDNESG